MNSSMLRIFALLSSASALCAVRLLERVECIGMLTVVPVALSESRVDWVVVVAVPLGSEESTSTISSTCRCNPSGFRSRDPFRILFFSFKRVKMPCAGEGKFLPFMLPESGE